jgi:uncharacterized membrane protein YozB (DUF420 family)
LGRHAGELALQVDELAAGVTAFRQPVGVHETRRIVLQVLDDGLQKGFFGRHGVLLSDPSMVNGATAGGNRRGHAKGTYLIMKGSPLFRRWSLMNGPNVILVLKVAVVAVTCLLLASLVALARGNLRWHGRINTVFFVLTITALIGLELIVRILDPAIFDDYSDAWRHNLYTHLCFSVPAAILLPFMLWTGKTHRGTIHLVLACVFGVLWIGTFVTGVFFL